MKNRRNRLHKLYIIVGVAFLIGLSCRERPSVQAKILQENKDTAGEIVVIFENKISADSLDLFLTSVETPIEVLNHIEDYALLRVEDEKEYPSVLSALQESSMIAVAQANDSISILKISEDPYSASQWALDNPGWYTRFVGTNSGDVTATEGVDMDVAQAWELLNKDKNDLREVVVAIIDTGIDYLHPDLSKNMWLNENEISQDGIDNDNNGYIDDIFGWDFYNGDSSVCHYEYNEVLKLRLSSPEDRDDHGTHCAGTIAAVANNNIGIAGIASNVNVKLMSLKINGGDKGYGNIANAIEAIKYATRMGADICNLSWGSYQYNEALEQVMKESDMLFVAAAGNDGTNNNSDPIYPASYDLDNVISVTFSDSNGELPPLSNYGTTTVDLAAPGEDIYSTIVGSYASMSGSSMAAPHVSAIAAMLYSYDEYLYPSNIKEIILESIKPLESLEGFLLHPGIPSAYRALMSLESIQRDLDAPKITFQTIYNKGELIVPIYSEDSGGSNIRAIKWLLGNKDLSDFERGMAGTSVSDNQVAFKKAGTYSFYVSDYAGNAIVEKYKVLDDTISPKIATSYTVSNNYKTKTIKIKISDNLSGIKKVKYLKGDKKTTNFLPASAGTEIKIKDGIGTFTVTEDGIYSIYGADYRGNNIVTKVSVKVIKATEIIFGGNSGKTLNIGSHYTLKVLATPINTTDRITYVSSNQTVASVSTKGVVTALKAGKATIKAKTSSGITASCEITVKKP